VGNDAGRINKVALRRARLVLRWKSKLPQYVTSHPGQLSFLPSAEQDISQSAAMLCGWGVKQAWFILFVNTDVGDR